MADLGNLTFGVHLQDYTDAEADKIKKKLENLSVKLNIDAKNSTVSNTDTIKKQIEAAVKSINIASVKVDASSVKSQIEAAVKGSTPQVSVTLLKSSLANDLQAYLNGKVFTVGITITRGNAQSAVSTAFANVSVPVSVTLSATAALQQLRQSLANTKVKVDFEAKNSTDIIKNLQAQLKGKKVKIDVEADKQSLIQSVKQSLQGVSVKAHVNVGVDAHAITRAVQSAINNANFTYSPNGNKNNPNAAARATNNLANSYRNAAGAANQFARASVTLSNGLRTNIRLGGQLGTVLGNFASVFGIKDLLKDVVAIGGQLENQRIALGAILQDGGKATAMFDKIQSLAVKSPFGIMDLNQYVKQLSAYQVPYNELYDTMKRLADISAGVGVDMGRIILAFGQVKAAGFLKGTELRQFTEANIPMVKALADRFTELTGKMVSAGEVYDMISKKMVTFEDVKSVLWDLTDEGGMFNNMQEVLSESLASKWKNLADAVDVMFGKIADGWIGSSLKGVAELLTDVTKGWEYVATAIGSATSSFLIYKAAVILGSKQMASTKSLYASFMADKRIEANNLRVAKTYRALTRAEQSLIATTNKLTVADIKRLARAKSLNKEEALRLISLRKLDAATLAYVQRLYGIDDAQVRTARSSTLLNRAMIQAGNGLRVFWNGLKTIFSNPWTWAFAVITAAFEGIAYLANKSSESKQRIKDSLQTATEGYNNLTKSIKEFEGTPISESGLLSGVEEMTSQLKDYASNWGEILGEVFKRDDEGEYVYSLSERYALLNNKLKDTKEAYKLLATEINGFMESANKSTDGWWDESFRENLVDASEAMGEYRSKLIEITKEGVRYEKAILAAAKADNTFAEAIKGKNLKEQFELLKDASDEAKAAFEKESAYIGMGGYNLVYAINYLKEQQETALKDAKKFVEKYKELLKNTGWDINNLTEPQKIAIGVDFTQYFDGIEDLDDATKRFFLQKTIEDELHIKVTTEFLDKTEAEKWKRELIEAAGGEPLQTVVKTLITTAPDYNSVVESIRKLYKESKEVVDNLNPVLLKVGLSPDGLTEIGFMQYSTLDKEAQKAVEGYNEAVRKIQAAKNIAKDQGFSLEENKRGSSSTKDPVAEMWKKRSEEIDKAVAAYDKWKQIEGSGKAEQRIKGMDEFANLFNGKYGFTLDLESPTDAYRVIQSKLNQAKDEQRELYVKLGVKLSDAEFKDAKDRLSAYLDETKKFIDKTTSQWNLYKKLFEATGDKTVSANIAFGGQITFKDQLEQIRAEIEKQLKTLGVTISFDKLLGLDEVSLKEAGLSSLSELIKAYNNENKKLTQDSIDNFIEIIKASKDFAQQIEDIDRKLQKDLSDLRTVGKAQGMDNETIQRKESELIKNAEEQKTKIRFEEFKESSDWVKVFDDLDRVSDATLDNMISKVEEFAKQAHLSEEVTKQLVEAMAKLRNEAIDRNPFEGFKDAWNRLNYYKSLNSKVGEYDEHGKLVTQQMVDDGIAEANKDLEDSALAVADKFKAVADVSDMLSGLFESMGISMDGFLGAISSVLGGAASGAQTGAGIASALGAAGPWGAVAGAAVGMLSSVFAMHDKALQKEIEASERREEYIKNVADNLEDLLDRNMGGIYTMGLDDETKKMLREIINGKDGNIFKQDYTYSAKTRKKAQEALRENSYYDAQYASLLAQRDEIQKQMELEDEKKKTDKDKMADYQQQLAEMEQEIAAFVETMANELYGIDFKGWANQLAESLVDAWASGEDAVKAYKNTVTDILRDLGVSIITQKIIEPMLNKTMEQFIDQFNKDNGKITDASMKILAGMYDEAEYAAKATEAYLEGLKELGIDLSEKSDEAGGLSKSIQSVTEETADLLASYVNAIRADVAVKRILLEKLISEDMPQISVIAQAQLTQLNNIAANTLRNADAADKIYDLVNRVVDKGSNKLKI